MLNRPGQDYGLHHGLAQVTKDLADSGSLLGVQGSSIKERPRYDPVQDRYRGPEGDATAARPLEQQHRPLQKRISHEEMEVGYLPACQYTVRGAVLRQ